MRAKFAQSGISLIELLASMGIVVLVMTTIMVGQELQSNSVSKFERNQDFFYGSLLGVQKLAEDVELALEIDVAGNDLIVRYNKLQGGVEVPFEIQYSYQSPCAQGVPVQQAIVIPCLARTMTGGGNVSTTYFHFIRNFRWCVNHNVGAGAMIGPNCLAATPVLGPDGNTMINDTDGNNNNDLPGMKTSPSRMGTFGNRFMASFDHIALFDEATNIDDRYRPMSLVLSFTNINLSEYTSP